MRITYNAPFVLTLSLLSTVLYLLDNSELYVTYHFFSVGPGFHFSNPIDYFRLFSHAIGHLSWNHLISNFSFILLLGPILEEKYGSKRLLLMSLVTAVVTGVLNLILFSTGLLGASGIVFMMIMLASFSNFRRGEIPLSFILIAMLFIGREVLNAFKDNNVSEFAHILGGICGAVFGFRWSKPDSSHN